MMALIALGLHSIPWHAFIIILALYVMLGCLFACIGLHSHDGIMACHGMPALVSVALVSVGLVSVGLISVGLVGVGVWCAEYRVGKAGKKLPILRASFWSQADPRSSNVFWPPGIPTGVSRAPPSSPQGWFGMMSATRGTPSQHALCYSDSGGLI
jgi:hypothetical protein